LAPPPSPLFFTWLFPLVSLPPLKRIFTSLPCDKIPTRPLFLLHDIPFSFWLLDPPPWSRGNGFFPLQWSSLYSTFPPFKGKRVLFFTRAKVPPSAERPLYFSEDKPNKPSRATVATSPRVPSKRYISLFPLPPQSSIVSC